MTISVTGIGSISSNCKNPNELLDAAVSSSIVTNPIRINMVKNNGRHYNGYKKGFCESGNFTYTRQVILSATLSKTDARKPYTLCLDRHSAKYGDKPFECKIFSNKNIAVKKLFP